MFWESKSAKIEACTPKYTWSQTIHDVTINLQVPEGTSGKDVEWSCRPDYLHVGIKGQPYLMQGETAGIVKPSESVWTLEDKKHLCIQLQKAKAHDSWSSVIKNEYVLDPLTKEKMDKNMMLEKFQYQYPGFDFSKAEMTGKIPDDPANYLHPNSFEDIQY
ncbi:nudC domain-containing protein 2-like [Schistocerca gregaria]|uniref:nudC domain-containing protein 2-like n=1 Tax=Schistocerca gregaria TaxID=7010 RepID=UPI00211E654E|nr:nudC domain-containing protein 2-like [Schistocerca gregaria]